MRLFSKTYIINLEENNLDLESLNIDSLEQVNNLKTFPFVITSLGFFNQVVAKFEKHDSNKIALKIELPKSKYYLQLVAVAFLPIIGIALFFSEEYNTSPFLKNIIICSIPICITIMGYSYQKEFLKESEDYFNEVTNKMLN